jgi:hypothetical protein
MERFSSAPRFLYLYLLALHLSIREKVTRLSFVTVTRRIHARELRLGCRPIPCSAGSVRCA